VRARGELFQDLLNIEFEGRLKKQWDDCNKFLLALAKFRNAIAHWHPYMNVYASQDGSRLKYVPAIGALALGELEPLEEKDIAPFIEDCYYIRQEIMGLRVIAIDRRSSPIRDKYPELKFRPNLAVLQQRPRPKASQPPRPPSVPKLSPAQKRAKALKDAKGKKKK
jgi:hypothetical protein